MKAGVDAAEGPPRTDHGARERAEPFSEDNAAKHTDRVPDSQGTQSEPLSITPFLPPITEEQHCRLYGSNQ